MNTAEQIEGAPLIAPSTTDHPLYDQVVEACRTVYDPEIPVNIYDLGLVYTVAITVELRVSSVPGIRDAEVNLVWDPPWDPAKMSDEARLELGML